MDFFQAFFIPVLAIAGIIYLVWRKRNSRRDVHIILGKIATTFVFGVVGLLLGVWVAVKLSSPSSGEYAGIDLLGNLILTVPTGTIVGTIFGMAFFKVVGKLLSQKKYEKK